MLSTPTIEDVQPFLARLEGVRKNGNGWTARCPAHEDRRASLSVSEGEDGRLLAHCHAGCGFAEILAAADMPRRSVGPSAMSTKGPHAPRGVIAEYDYTDANGKLLYQVQRLDGKAGFPQRRPNGSGGWIPNLNGVSPVPYHLPEVIEAASLGKEIFVVEGEKDVENLRALGLVATCNSGGAGKWREEHAQHFKGCSRVLVLPDNDPPGERHAEQVANSLRAVVPDVRVLRLEGLPPKGDVSDWLAKGNTLAQLYELIENPPSTPAAVFPTVRVMVEEPPAIPSVQVERLMLDREINLLTGFGAAGKSAVLLHIVVCVATGRPVFGTLAVRRPATVLLILPEDGQAAARMMLDAIAEGMGLTDEEKRVLGERLVMVTDECAVNITTDATKIAATARAHGAELVAIDPIRNVLGGEPENDNDVAGACLDALRREVCRAAGCTLVLTQHERKPGKDATADTAPSVHDVRGAGGWVNGSRNVFNVRKQGTRITLTSTKANRVRADVRHEVELHIVADPENEARWLSCRLQDANAGANSESLTPGKGRALNANEQAVLSCLDDRHEPGKRLSWSRWAKETGINTNTFKSIRDRLLNAGLASAVPTGKRTRNNSPEYAYEITPDGRQSIASGWTSAPAKGEGVTKGE